MKRLFLPFIVSVGCLAGLAACKDTPVDPPDTDEPEVVVTEITLDETETSMLQSETLQLTATVLPENATDNTVEWKSSDEAVATVDGNGLVTPADGADGTTTITVTAKDGSGVSATCEVSVNLLGKTGFKTPAVWTVGTQTWSDAVVASGAKKDSYDGGSQAGYKPDFRQNAPYGDLFSWTAVKVYGDLLCPDEWRVPSAEDFSVLDMALNARTDSNGRTGDVASVERYTDPAIWGGEFGGAIAGGQLYYQKISAYYWTLDTPYEGAGICMNFGVPGVVYPQAEYEMNGGFAVRCVKDATEGTTVAVACVELGQSSVSLLAGGNWQLTWLVLPFDATNKKVTWSSSNEGVAKVVGGLVTGVAPGTATITVTTDEGDHTDTCEVTVTAGETGFRTPATWAVGAQIWSDVVMAEVCKKESFYGGLAETSTYLSDCRENVSGYGDLFSWTFIAENADMLCPDEWSVPTPADFVDLAKALGGTGDEQYDKTLFDRLLSDKWGGELGGTCNYNGQITLPGINAIYGTAEYDTASGLGYALSIYTDGYRVRPGMAIVNRGYGFPVRCVK